MSMVVKWASVFYARILTVCLKRKNDIAGHAWILTVCLKRKNDIAGHARILTVFLNARTISQGMSGFSQFS